MKKDTAILLLSSALCFAIAAGITTHFNNDSKDKEQQVIENQRVIDSLTRERDNYRWDHTYKRATTRGFDYKNKTYVPYINDEQVRTLRENNPEYIIKIPGRQIKNRRDLHEQYIEDYIESNPEVLDEYRD